MLPAVDIDTDISEMSEIFQEEAEQKERVTSPERKPKKHVQIVSPRGTPNKTPGRSPSKAHYEVIYHEVQKTFCLNEDLTDHSKYE